MMKTSVYQEIAARTGGNVYVGVVGPVRTGKSTFIKRFMELLVLPQIQDAYALERAKDELPQCASGRTIMTAEPKFIPEAAAQLSFDGGVGWSLRMVDCVGFMVDGAVGNTEDGMERMVMTPWYAGEIPMSQAAEEGTRRVIAEHSTVGILVTTDGTVCDIPREAYLPAEERAVRELTESGKPYVILLNCEDPESERARTLACELEEAYRHICLPVNCRDLTQDDLHMLISALLQEFPVTQYSVWLPTWMDAVGEESEYKSAIFSSLREAAQEAECMADVRGLTERLSQDECVEGAEVTETDMATGIVSISVSLPKRLYYEIISRESGFPVRSDRELMLLLRSVSGLKKEYERVHDALESARTTGYGIVMPTMEEMRLEEPEIVRQGGRYGVRLKASAPSIHMVLANIETEVSPAIGGEKASEEVINFLLQGYDGDVNRIWESNIFGKPLNDIAGEGLASKIRAMPEDAQTKLRATIQRIINEGSGGLICILL